MEINSLKEEVTFLSDQNLKSNQEQISYSLEQSKHL